MTSAPLFSIVSPIYDTPLDVLGEMIHSVTSQGFPHWELILVDDVSPDQRVRDVLAEAAAADPRVRVILRETNGGISAASNDGLAAATGTYLALLDHDDLLVHGALAKIAAVLIESPEIDYLYTDEDKIDKDNHLYDRFDKPDWSPERLRAHMYTGHLSVFRLSLVRDVGGFDSEFDGSQDHDLVLKVTERAAVIHHLPEVLYHWRALPKSTASSGNAKPYTWDAGLAAVTAHVKRIGLDAVVEQGPWFGIYATHRQFDENLTVSVIIPTRGGRGVIGSRERVYVVEAVRSLVSHAGHDRYEIVVVADEVTPEAVLDELRDIAGTRLVIVPYAKEFNYSEKCNLGFLHSTGDIIVMLNDDIEVITENFIPELCAPLAEADVGMTGAYLIYENGWVQHAGHRYARRHFMHAFSNNKLGDTGPFCALLVDREVSGLTAACVALRREVYEEVGGLSQQLPVNFNDVDLSLKLRSAGYRLLWLNRVKLYHYESKTRVAVVHQFEVDRLRARWGVPDRDAFSHE